MTDAATGGLSVIIPTHNGRRSVLDTVNAILADGYPELEVLIVSDGASGQTRALISELTDPRVTLLEKDKEGAAAARNHGLRAAKYDWVAFVDDDDVPRARWVQSWLEAASTGVQVITSSVARHSADGTTTIRPCKLDPSDATMGASALLAGSFWIKRDLLGAIGGYDLQLHFAENQDLGLRLIDSLKPLDLKPHITFLTQPVIDVYVQEPSKRDRRYGSAQAESARLFLARYKVRLSADPTHKASLLRIIARAERMQRLRSASVLTAFRAVRTEPTNLANLRSLLLAFVPSLAKISQNTE